MSQITSYTSNDEVQSIYSYYANYHAYMLWKKSIIY